MSDIYFCNDCKQFFTEDEAGTESELHTELDGHWCETFMVCPHCGSDDYEEAYECEICGEPTLTEICGQCETEIVGKIGEFVSKLTEEYKCDTSIIQELMVKWIDDN